MEDERGVQCERLKSWFEEASMTRGWARKHVGIDGKASIVRNSFVLFVVIVSPNPSWSTSHGTEEIASGTLENSPQSVGMSSVNRLGV